ncbi:MepB family protein [Leucobacter sp. gxy201]|uniref:MepB family protein n=1 Tax=Leucobacter sp. gxy201 TaxID=2957200 RepID=UPI003DA0E9F9
MQFCALHEFFDIVGDRYGVPGAPQAEDQSGDYESGTVMIGAEHWRIRTARVTPRKPGAFVAVWKRDEAGETKPFASDEEVDGLLVFVREAENFGVFRFAASHLEVLGVTRSSAYPGKRGFRVYPHWSEGLNPQATRAQKAQSEAFIMLR